MKVAILAAMKEELAPFRRYFSGSQSLFQRGKTHIEQVHPPQGSEISALYLVETGIGKVNAAATTAWLMSEVGPDVIINTGSTGCFDQRLALGDVVVSDRFIYSDVDATGFDYAWGQVPQMPADYPVAEVWLEKIQTYFDSRPEPLAYALHRGTIATSDSFMSDPVVIAGIRSRQSFLLASDMESAAIAQVASAFDCLVLNVRGISDHVGEAAPALFKESLALAAEHAFDAVVTLVEKVL